MADRYIDHPACVKFIGLTPLAVDSLSRELDALVDPFEDHPSKETHCFGGGV